MSLTAVQVTFLQSLAARPTLRENSKAAEYFGLNYALGVRVGRQWEYNTADAGKAASILQSLGLPLLAGTGGRQDRAATSQRPGLSEKTGTTAPHADSVAVMALSAPVPCGNGWLQLQPFGYTVATVDEVAQCTPVLVVLVENLETFRQLRRYRWLLGALPKDGGVLAIYRGDRQFKMDAAAAALQRLRATVWGFFDFDPAGLGLAAAVPRLELLILPPQAVLERVAFQTARFDLWAQQQEQYFATLEGCQNPSIQQAWGWLKRWKRCVPQEWLRDLD